MALTVQKPKKDAAETVRWVNTLEGSMALGPCQISTLMNAMARMPARTSRTMTRASCQAYLRPPHCRARRRQTMDGRRATRPKRSRVLRNSVQEVKASWSRFGGWTRKKKAIWMTAPMGRLM